ncbi:hypothetical protein F5Y17DRAFT_419414 [Xylariaceae sp. FL0594]|nr:hypothetical protein F5Y17DRAFT_419414 [Xylariaceae sp. FL0594]
MAPSTVQTVCSPTTPSDSNNMDSTLNRPKCGICGMIVADKADQDAASWLREYRVLYSTGPASGATAPELSGVALYDQGSELAFVPPEPHQRYDDFGPGKLSPREMIPIRNGLPPSDEASEASDEASDSAEKDTSLDWCFRFHDSCWSLLEQACAPYPVDLKMLRRILISVPFSCGVPNWGHDYGGLYRSRVVHKSRYVILRSEISPLPTTNIDAPFRVPDIVDKMKETRKEVGQQAHASADTPDGTPPKSPIPPSSASVSTSTRLPPSGPFSKLAFRLRDMLPTYVNKRASSAFASTSKHDLVVRVGEWDRCRIWEQTLQPLKQAMEDVARLSELKGRRVYSSRYALCSCGCVHLDSPREGIETLPIAYHLPDTPGIISFPLDHKTRIVQVNLPSRIEAIHVSLMPFFSKTYITGIAFTPSRRQRDGAQDKDGKLGRENTEDEQVRDMEIGLFRYGHVLRSWRRRGGAQDEEGKLEGEETENEEARNIEIGYMRHGHVKSVKVKDGRLFGFFGKADECGILSIAPDPEYWATAPGIHPECAEWVVNVENGRAPVGVLPQRHCVMTGKDVTVGQVRATFDGFKMRSLYLQPPCFFRVASPEDINFYKETGLHYISDKPFALRAS